MFEIFSANQCKEMDRYTINNMKIPGIILMENAAIGIFNTRSIPLYSEEKYSYIIKDEFDTVNESIKSIFDNFKKNDIVMYCYLTNTISYSKFKLTSNVERDCKWLRLRPEIQKQICVPGSDAFKNCVETCNSCKR